MTSPNSTSHAPAKGGLDPRGPRFVAGVTSVVLVITLITGSAWVLAFQVVIFAIGSLVGVTASPYSWLYRTLVRPRLAPPAELEAPEPVRFAQTVGLIVTGLGLVLAVAGVSWAVPAFAALALVAAVLNAGFGLCIGCEMYLAIARLRSRTA